MKRLISIFLALTLVLGVVQFGAGAVYAEDAKTEVLPTEPAAAAPAEPEACEPLDTIPDGYTPIYDAFDLYFIRNDLTGSYILMNDIDLGPYLVEGGDLYNAEGWIAFGFSPVSANCVAFSGTFDGNGHTISGLICDGAGAGLFWKIGENGTIKNLTIASGSIKGALIQGSIAQMNYGTIYNCHNYANVFYNSGESSNVILGGIVGVNYSSGTIRNCSNSGEITVDGIAWYNCYASAGGITGENAGILDMVCNHGSIMAKSGFYCKNGVSYFEYGSMAGGIVGRVRTGASSPAKLSNAYNTGSINAENIYNTYYSAYAHAGGIVGYYYPANSNQQITCCYNIGQISATSAYDGYQLAGGICGYICSDVNTITYSYYLSSIGKESGNSTPTGILPLGPSQMILHNSFAGFNFDGVWTMGVGDYPYPVFGENGDSSLTYNITTAEELWAIRSDMSGNYVLMNDIDMSELLAVGGGMYTLQGWIAIGYVNSQNDCVPFTGTLDGNGHTISGLICDGAGAGLFWKIGENGTIKNLTIASGSIKGALIQGSIAQMNYGTIYNCHNYANVFYNSGESSNVILGGIVGVNYSSGTIRNCSNSGEITVDGIAWYNCYASAGGITGENAGILDMVCNHGSIMAKSGFYCKNGVSYFEYGSMAGGIVGRVRTGASSPAKLSNAYNTGSINAENIYNTYYSAYAHAGGIVGYYYPANSNQQITCCYNIGQISATSAYSGYNYAGGICGFTTAGENSITYCYYLNTIERGIGNNTSNSCIALSNALMKRQQSYIGFDFSSIWTMGYGDYPYPILNHIHTLVYVEAVNPTCTTDGNIEYWTCSTCGRCFIDEEGTQDIPAESIVVPGGHNFTDVVIQPTCTADGYTKHVCSRCGTYYIDTYVAPLGHDIVTESVIQPTCTEPGRTAGTHCSRCDYVESGSEVIPPLGHDYQGTVALPSCTTQGYSTYTCSRCGESYVDDYVPALGHDFGGWTQVTAPTCTEPGVLIRTCSRCEETETSNMNPPGHDWGEPVYSWTDDYAYATAIHVCKRDASHVESETAATIKQIIKEATYTEEGEIVYTAVFTNPVFAAQTKTVVIPKLQRENPFEDVKEGKYYYDAVLWAISQTPPVTNGTDETHFSPNKTCTRGQVVTFLWNAMGQPAPDPNDNPFVDVKPGKYYTDAVLWAYQTGVTTGTDATHFSPGKDCTRGQVVTFLWNAMGKPEPESTANPFTDVKEGKFYYKAVLWAVENGVTNGTSDTTFSPNKTCTRGQVVTFLYNALAK